MLHRDLHFEQSLLITELLLYWYTLPGRISDRFDHGIHYMAAKNNVLLTHI